MLGLLEKQASERGHHTLGLGVDDPRPKRLYLRLGYMDTDHDYLDQYTWIDEHHVANQCRWMMKMLVGDRTSTAQN